MPLCFRILLLILFISNPPVVKADYQDYLVRSAREQELHKARYWRILLHYKETLFGGSESLVDDPRFFLARDGKYNPESELTATIRGFFRKNGAEEDHPVCRFTARYAWLKEKLAIDPSKLPVPECGPFGKVMDQLKPESAVLVFPTYFMNSPASMFGHTLITIETAYKSRLLSHAVNYSAMADETNGLFFAVKGLTGFYKGYYSILPYYQKIQEYSDISQRDMWEYRLNLTGPEVERMIRHIWELRDIFTDYYFFDENCSYNLLYLLEAARPSARLIRKFPLWALPIDTIKAVKAEGMIDGVDYRPSKAAKIRHKISGLSPENQQIVLDIIKGKTDPDSILCENISEKLCKEISGAGKADRIRIADLAAEYLQYQYAKKKIPKARYQNLFLHVLKARSRLGKPAEPLYHLAPRPRPDKIHETNRLCVGIGVQKDRLFQEIGLRPVFADLLDTDYDHAQGIQLEFGDIRFRYYFSDETFRLESLDIIDIISVSPVDKFFRPYSWRFSTGLSRKPMPGDRDSLVYKIGTGGGLALYHDIVGLCYLFAEPELNVGGALDKNYAMGIGISAGVLKQITPCWKSLLSAKKTYFELGDKHRLTELSFSQHLRLTRNNSLSVDLLYRKAFDSSYGEIRFSWNIYF